MCFRCVIFPLDPAGIPAACAIPQGHEQRFRGTRHVFEFEGVSQDGVYTRHENKGLSPFLADGRRRTRVPQIVQPHRDKTPFLVSKIRYAPYMEVSTDYKKMEKIRLTGNLFFQENA
jgi:hypothetical protein